MKMEDEGITLLDSNLELKSILNQRLYPGDLVCYRAKKPYEWIPWFGEVLSPNSPFVKYVKMTRKYDFSPSSLEDSDIITNKLSTQEQEQEQDNEPLTWSHDDGLPNPIYVQWSHSNRIGTIRDRSEISLVDRNLVKGQRVKDEFGTFGTVVDIVVKTTLQVLNTNHIIDNIPVRNLSPVSPFVRGREIQFRGWIGVITTVKRDVKCRLDNGGIIFVLKTNESDGFMKMDPFWGAGMPCPGIRNKFSPAVMKKADFSSRFMRFIHHYVPPVAFFYTRSSSTTVGVEAVGLEVMWLQRCPTSTIGSEIPPPKIITTEAFDEVKPLGLPNYETVGLNSVRMYNIQPEDSIISYSTWFGGFQSKFVGVPAKSYSHFFPTPNVSSNLLCQPGYDVPVKIIFRQAEVEIEWDNGASEHMLAARIPILVPSFTEAEFQPGLVVQPIMENQGLKKYGVVLTGEIYGSNTVKVRWILPESEADDNIIHELGIKNESIYDIKPHTSICMYQRGTTVFIKNHPDGYETGTVIDVNLCLGNLLLAVPESQGPITVYPHTISPMAQRSYWNFFSRSWVTDTLLPPLFQHIYEGVGIPNDVAIPLSLSVKNNNNSSSRIRVGDILVEPAFGVLNSSPEYHRYTNWELRSPTPDNLRGMRNELINLKEAILPDGVWIRGYEDRNDLYSAMFLGPEKTPYEDGLFFFDLQLSEEFPKVPPRIHHIPYTTQSISPFIAVEGAFCVSKINWDFDTPPQSYISNVLGQIQEMIFCPEPYYNQFGKEEVEKETAVGLEKSRAYNEQIFMNVLTSFYTQIMTPYDPWRRLIAQHVSLCLPFKLACVNEWIKKANTKPSSDVLLIDMDTIIPTMPSFNLLPVSKGFQTAIVGRIEKLEKLVPRPLELNGSPNIPDLHSTNSVNTTITNNGETEGSSLKSDGSGSTIVESETNEDIPKLQEIIT